MTTFGKSSAEGLDAAAAGNHLKRYLGWPEEFCNALPCRAVRKR